MTDGDGTAPSRRGVGAAVSEQAPRLLATILGPILRARGAGDAAFLAPATRSHADALGALPRDHWERVIDAYELRGCGAVLDVACGSGDWLAPLARVNDRVVGVDVDESMLAHARERAGGSPNVEIQAMSGESLGFADATFDAVTCMSALPYLDQEVAVGEMARVLRPGGRLVLGTVGPGYYAKHIAEGIRQRDDQAVRYGFDPLLVTAGRRVRGSDFADGSLQTWSPRSVGRLLERHGFTVERSLRDVAPIDPAWPQSFLGWPVYLVVFARRRGAR